MTRSTEKRPAKSSRQEEIERGSCELVISRDLHAIAGVEVPFTGGVRGTLRVELRFDPQSGADRLGTAKVRIFIQQGEDIQETPKPDRFARKPPVAFSAPDSLPAPAVSSAAATSSLRTLPPRKSTPLLILSGFLIAGMAFWIGYATGALGDRDPDAVASFVPTARIFWDANHALSMVQSGNPAEGLRLLAELDDANPGVPGLTYLVARTALEAGDLNLAESRIAAAIAESERVSDALALSAHLEGLSAPGEARLSSPDESMKLALRQAVEADISNPYPLIDLANLLRSTGETGEARVYLEAARYRLPPVDAGPVVEASLRLLELDSVPVASISRPLTRTPVDLIVNAYVEFRLGDNAKGESFLEDCRKSTPPELFEYLVADPVMKKWLPAPRVSQHSSP